ncbi:MAG: hypothetical protein ACRDWG_19340 [Actinomycetes bacterium]
MLKETSAVADRKGNAPAISVRGLGKRFGDRVAFDGVSFDVGYGEVFGFLGPNGAGRRVLYVRRNRPWRRMPRGDV